MEFEIKNTSKANESLLIIYPTESKEKSEGFRLTRKELYSLLTILRKEFKDIDKLPVVKESIKNVIVKTGEQIEALKKDLIDPNHKEAVINPEKTVKKKVTKKKVVRKKTSKKVTGTVKGRIKGSEEVEKLVEKKKGIFSKLFGK